MACFAARRSVSLWCAAASERVVLTLVAGPKQSRSQWRMHSDHEPRGSLGSQNPRAEKMKWKPRIMGRMGQGAAEPRRFIVTRALHEAMRLVALFYARCICGTAPGLCST